MPSRRNFLISSFRCSPLRKRRRRKATVQKGNEDSKNKTVVPPVLPAREPDFLISPAQVTLHEKPVLAEAVIPPKVRKGFEKLKADMPKVFSESAADLGRTNLMVMDIDTGDSSPIAQRPYNIPLAHREWAKRELEILERAQVIERSMSPWASPVVIVPKKSAPDEPPRRRMCVDYRALNSLAPPVKRPFSRAQGVLAVAPLPKIDDMLARLHGAKIFSTLDLRSGFYHIVLTPEAQEKTAFVTAYGKFKFLRVPFGLSQAPSHFQALIDQVLVGCDHFAMGYLDDVVIFSATPEEHLQHIKTIFERLQAADLKLKESKCAFFLEELHYLGHIVSADGVRPMPDKLDSIRKLAPPTTVKEIQQFLGLAGYYRKFVPRYSDVTRPLTDLLRQDQEYLWTEECNACFALLKEYLCAHPVLTYPDPSKPYVLYTDASKFGWAGLLLQEHDMIYQGREFARSCP